MTTIAYRKYINRVEFACDSYCEQDGRAFSCEKFSLAEDGLMLIMAAGRLSALERAVGWSKCDFGVGAFVCPDPEDESVLLIARNGKVYDADTQEKQTQECHLSFKAYGSGGKLAEGIMACEKTPGEAVAIIRDKGLDVAVGMEIHQFRMDPDSKSLGFQVGQSHPGVLLITRLSFGE